MLDELTGLLGLEVFFSYERVEFRITPHRDEDPPVLACVAGHKIGLDRVQDPIGPRVRLDEAVLAEVLVGPRPEPRIPGQPDRAGRHGCPAPDSAAFGAGRWDRGERARLEGPLPPGLQRP